MKIVHICTNDSGGAALAAIRLHRGMLKANIDSSILFLYNNRNLTDSKGVYYFLKESSIFKKSIQSIRYRFIELIKKILLIGKSNTEYKFHFSPFDLNKHPAVRRADIIHLHWVCDFLDYKSFFRKNKKPVFWTLHDLNPFSGGFHYYIDKELAGTAYEKLEKWVTKEKTFALQKFIPLCIICPSDWILTKSTSSSVFKRFTHQQIFNCIDENQYYNKNKVDCRKALNLPLDKFIILFVADNIDDKRKGFSILLGALSEMSDKDIIIVTVGRLTNRINEDNWINFGRVDSNEVMADIYNASDCFLLPSLEDNLPNTMLEALMCGTPIIAFNTGGMSQVIINRYNGLLIEEPSTSSFKNGILFMKESYRIFDKAIIAEEAKKTFNASIIVEQHISSYKKMSYS